MVLLAALTLLAIVFVHSGNRVTAALAMGVFAAAVSRVPGPIPVCRPVMYSTSRSRRRIARSQGSSE